MYVGQHPRISSKLLILNTGFPELTDPAKNSRKHEYLDKMIGPQLPQKAAEITTKLSSVFRGLSGPSIKAPQTEVKSLEFREHCRSQWRLHTEATFLQLLKLVLAMEKTSYRYLFRLPAMSEDFDKGWMKPAHATGAKIPDKSIVYTCLSPAVFIVERGSNPKEVLVVPALVMIQGLEVDPVVF